MGNFLSMPNTTKNSGAGEDDRLVFGHSAMQGWRFSMEDAHTAILDLQNSDEAKNTPLEERLSFFSVFDGHVNYEAARFCGENVYKILMQQAAFRIGDYAQALKDCFLATDDALRKTDVDGSGTTATAALFADGQVYVANAGDSRAVLCARGEAKPLSYDHKPWKEVEKSRITAAGGFIECGRVNNILAMSRAIGNFKFKKSTDLPAEEQMVTALPDVIVHEITDEDEFLVIACDGIWDCESSQAVMSFVRYGISMYYELHTICEKLMDYFLASETERAGDDNMTMIIIGILHGKTKKEWYDTIAQKVANDDGPCAPAECEVIFGLGEPNSANIKRPGGDDNGTASHNIARVRTDGPSDSPNLETKGGSSQGSEDGEVLGIIVAKGVKMDDEKEKTPSDAEEEKKEREVE